MKTITKPLTSPSRIATRVRRPSRQLVQLETKRVAFGLTDAEKAALDDIYAAQEREALSEADVDRMAEQDAEGRLFTHRHPNPHD